MGRMLGALFLLGFPFSQAGAEGVLLDWEDSYWRYQATFRPPRFASPFQDRKGRTFELLSYGRGWHIAHTQGRVSSPDTAADWMKPEFDDSAWPRERRPEVG